MSHLPEASRKPPGALSEVLSSPEPGADVMYSTHWLLSHGLIPNLPPLAMLAALLASGAHDVGHSALGNSFLVKTGHPLAIQYNDRSPLENMHAATCFQVLNKPGCGVLHSLPLADRVQVRDWVIEAILATDMHMHMEQVALLDSISFTPQDTLSAPDTGFMLGIGIHAADVANPTKAPAIASRWARLVFTEFCDQGDQEKAAGLPVSLGDSEKPDELPSKQIAFAKYVVQPMYTAVQQSVPSLDMEVCFQNIEETRKFWEAEMDSTGKSLDQSLG